MLDGMPFPFREDDIDSELFVMFINAAFDADAVRQFKKHLIFAIWSLAGETIPVNRAALWQPVQVKLAFKAWIALHGHAPVAPQ